MTSPSVLSISRMVLSVIFVASLALGPNAVKAQEYSEEEYKAFEDIQAEKDAVKKTDMMVRFLKSNPKTALRPNVAAEFNKILASLEGAKNWTAVISLGERFVNVAPDDSYTVMTLARAYAETKNSKGFAEFGERAYAQKPSGELAYAIARAYLDVGNNAKFLQWGGRAAASMPDNVDLLFELTRRYGMAQNSAQSAKYARLCLKAIPKAKKPENVDEQTWKETVNAMYAASYAAVGGFAYQNQNYAEAIANLDNAVKHVKRNETAYYFLGMSYWQQNKIDAAMLNFAKAYVMKGSTSGLAKQYLDKLYRSSHRNSLVGQERVIARAEQDLK